MSAPRLRDRRGFSLAELAVSVMIVGILAGVAVPNLHSALLEAQASRIVSDAHTVSLAAYQHLAEHGTFPGSGPYGTIPEALAPHLPEGFDFAPDGIEYGWVSIDLPTSDNVWQTRTVGLFVVSYPDRPELAAALQRQLGPDRYWSGTLFYFLYRG